MYARLAIFLPYAAPWSRGRSRSWNRISLRNTFTRVPLVWTLVKALYTSPIAVHAVWNRTEDNIISSTDGLIALNCDERPMRGLKEMQETGLTSCCCLWRLKNVPTDHCYETSKHFAVRPLFVLMYVEALSRWWMHARRQVSAQVFHVW